MFHVRLDEMSRRESGHETEFTGHDCRCDYSGEALGVCSWFCGMGTGDAEHVEHRSLR